jgi:hypothetical protein
MRLNKFNVILSRFLQENLLRSDSHRMQMKCCACVEGYLDKIKPSDLCQKKMNIKVFLLIWVLMILNKAGVLLERKKNVIEQD